MNGQTSTNALKPSADLLKEIQEHTRSDTGKFRAKMRSHLEDDVWVYVWRTLNFDRRPHNYNFEGFVNTPYDKWFHRFKKIRNGKAVRDANKLDVYDLRVLCRENYDANVRHHHNHANTKWFLDYSYLDCVRLMMCDYDLRLYKHRNKYGDWSI